MKSSYFLKIVTLRDKEMPFSSFVNQRFGKYLEKDGKNIWKIPDFRINLFRRRLLKKISESTFMEFE